MEAVQLHLLLNHVPVIGTIFGLALLAYGLLRDQNTVVRAALWALVITGVAGVATYLSGEPAEEVIEEMAGVSEALIERHEEMAYWATGGAVVVGLVALVMLTLYRTREVGRGFAAVVLALALGTSGLMGWTAHLGGQVRHSEIRAGAVAGGGESIREGEDHEREDDDSEERADAGGADRMPA